MEGKQGGGSYARRMYCTCTVCVQRERRREKLIGERGKENVGTRDGATGWLILTLAPFWLLATRTRLDEKALKFPPFTRGKKVLANYCRRSRAPCSTQEKI